VQTGEMEVNAIRLDSGDLVQLSQQVRSLLPEVFIFASGDLDEYEIARLQAEGADIQGYGLGTKLVTGTPVNGVYKLVEIDGIPVMKGSTGKMTYPGRKQIFRRQEQDGIHDRLGLINEAVLADEQPLLRLVMKQGQSLDPPETLGLIRDRTQRAVAALPTAYRQLQNPATAEVEISTALQELTKQACDRIQAFL
jgi:nicotinate phosphoribosyltransferase